MFKLTLVLLLVFIVDSFSQILTSPPPANLVFVPCPYSYTFAKHPTLPMLYVSGYYAPESKNLITYPLNADGTVNTNGMRSYNYFTKSGTNELQRYSLATPIVLPEEHVLYLGAIASSATYYTSDTNNQEVAVVALDDAGQPGKLLKSFRTTHGEKEIRNWSFEPISRRLYISYHTYFGWIPVGKDGVPETNKFNLVSCVHTCWAWVFVPEWQRFYARQTDGALVVFKLGSNGVIPDFDQCATGWYRGAYNFDVSKSLRMIYFLNTAEVPAQLVMYQLTKEGRLTSLPRFFDLGDAVAFRFDFKGNRLFAWNDRAVLKSYPLDQEGVPSNPPQIFALRCGVIRNLILDERSGKMYVLCTESPPAK